jgi:hypothetical protein
MRESVFVRRLHHRHIDEAAVATVDPHRQRSHMHQHHRLSADAAFFGARHGGPVMLRLIITVENAGKVAAAIVLGFMAGVLSFVVWAILEHGAQ